MPIEPTEVAGEAELLLVGLDAVDRCCLALVPEPREILAAALDHQIEAVVALRGEVRRGARRHALADGAAVEHHHALAGLDQLVGHRHPGNARTDDDNVGGFLLVEGGSFVEDARLHPEGDASLTTNVHGSPADCLLLFNRTGQGWFQLRSESKQVGIRIG